MLHERAILPDEATGRCKRLDWTRLERARKAETALGWELGIAGIGVIGRCALKIVGPFEVVSYIPPPVLVRGEGGASICLYNSI